MKKFLILSTLAVAAFVGAYKYTHSKSYLESVYDDRLLGECAQHKGMDNALCLIGVSLVKNEVVSCMQKSFISTSDETIGKCLEKATQEIGK